MFRLAFLAAFLVVGLSSSYAQWEIEESNTTADLRGIHALGNGIAWASGTEGTVLRTTDDGKTWHLCATPPDADHLDFRGIQAFDASTAIVMSSGKGPLSRLYKTTDGCQTWTLLFTNPDPDGSWDDIALAPQRMSNKGPEPPGHLYILGEPVKGHFAVWVMRKPLESGHGQRPKLLVTSLPRAKDGETAFAESNSVVFPVPYPPLVFFPAGFGFVTGGVPGAR